MRKIYTSPDPVLVHVVKDLLEDNEIPAVIQGDNLVALRGEVPFTDSWASVMISDTADYSKALKVIEEFKSGRSAPADEWTCPACGESIGGQFTECWKCAPKTEQDQPLVSHSTQRNTNLLLRLGAAIFLFGILAIFLGAAWKDETLLTVATNLLIAGSVISAWALFTLFRNRG